MTAKKFVSTKRWSGDLAKHIPGGNWDGERASRGFVYAEQLYIEKVQDWWPKAAQDRGSWCLTIGNAEYIGNDLPLLERKLYKFAVVEGFCEDDRATSVGFGGKRPRRPVLKPE